MSKSSRPCKSAKGNSLSRLLGTAFAPTGSNAGKEIKMSAGTNPLTGDQSASRNHGLASETVNRLLPKADEVDANILRWQFEKMASIDPKIFEMLSDGEKLQEFNKAVPGGVQTALIKDLIETNVSASKIRMEVDTNRAKLQFYGLINGMAIVIPSVAAATFAFIGGDYLLLMFSLVAATIGLVALMSPFYSSRGKNQEEFVAE